MNCTADLWSDCGLDDAITPELTSRSIEAQVDALRGTLPARFVLGGLSLGAIVAMALAIRAPDRVAGLILASTNAKAPTDAQRQGWNVWLERLDAGVTARELQSSILPALLPPFSRSTRPDLVERTLAMGDATGEDALRNQLVMQGTRVDLRPGLAGVATPTLVVSGADDPICPPAFHTELFGALPRAHLETLDAGHLLPMEKAAEFGALVRGWVARQVE
jgi:pimeloyl-ACP methyl ester carboxylesterase